MGVFSESAALLISTLGGLYLLAVLIRFLLQVARADFYNPLSQAVVRITNPTVKLLRNIVPGYKGLDFSCLVLALIIEMVLIVVLAIVYGASIPGIGSIITWSLFGIIAFVLNIYFWTIIASIIMSFMMMFSGSMSPHPALQLIWQLTEPVMAPVRRVIPPMGGLDFSPIFIFIGIRLIQGIIYNLAASAGLIPALVVGI